MQSGGVVAHCFRDLRDMRRFVHCRQLWMLGVDGFESPREGVLARVHAGGGLKRNDARDRKISRRVIVYGTASLEHDRPAPTTLETVSVVRR
jgi:hypothetical protein